MTALLPLLGAILGLVVGSFVAVLVRRWPAGRSVGGRSMCDGCGATLRWWELVPLASHLALRGRCARCGGAIDPRHGWTELAGGAIGAAALAIAPGWPGLAGAALGWALLALALLDAAHFWLPDRLTLPLAVVGLGVGIAPLPDRIAGAVAGFALLWTVATLYRRNRGRTGLGLGDAKLFGALGAWLGWRMLPGVLLAACLLGLAWALALRLRGRPVGRATALPLGTLLAIAGWSGWAVLAAAGAVR
jgi:leader peptidase (prepilin peptidase)/N-methyltransferase